MNYGKCLDCKETIRYKDIPLCENCMQKTIDKLNGCIRTGAKTIKDMTAASGLSEKLVKALVLNGYVSINQETEEIKQEEQQNVYEKLAMLRELKESIGNNAEAPKKTNGGSMHYLDNHRRR